eukprot:gb/GECG01015226.1/.p1 GENE.gb/GECG01015226.1/~~gb/GECG01015226.1/.p1  ORF type:complete len:2608 (+),score=192.83 gb/GECG01015226.1/:1-7824(+)
MEDSNHHDSSGRSRHTQGYTSIQDGAHSTQTRGRRTSRGTQPPPPPPRVGLGRGHGLSGSFLTRDASPSRRPTVNTDAEEREGESQGRQREEDENPPSQSTTPSHSSASPLVKSQQYGGTSSSIRKGSNVLNNGSVPSSDQSQEDCCGIVIEDDSGYETDPGGSTPTRRGRQVGPAESKKTFHDDDEYEDEDEGAEDEDEVPTELPNFNESKKYAHRRTPQMSSHQEIISRRPSERLLALWDVYLHPCHGLPRKCSLEFYRVKRWRSQRRHSFKKSAAVNPERAIAKTRSNSSQGSSSINDINSTNKPEVQRSLGVICRLKMGRETVAQFDLRSISQIVHGRCGQNFARTQKFSSGNPALLNRTCCIFIVDHSVVVKADTVLPTDSISSFVPESWVTDESEISIQFLNTNSRTSCISLILASAREVQLDKGNVAVKGDIVEAGSHRVNMTYGERFRRLCLRWKTQLYSSVELASDYMLALSPASMETLEQDLPERQGGSSLDDTVSLPVNAESPWPHKIGGKGKIGWFARLIDHSLFRNFILLVIIVNAITIALSQETRNDNGGVLSVDLILTLEIMFSTIYTLEMIVKMIALEGVKGYVLDGWNVLDGLVVLAGWAALAVVALPESVVSLRVLRVLRVLRSVRFFSGARQFIDTAFSTLPPALKTVLIYLVFVLIFASVGVDLFGETLSMQCVVPEPTPDVPYSDTNSLSSGYAPDGYGVFAASCRNDTFCDAEESTRIRFRPILDPRFCSSIEPFPMPPVNGSTVRESLPVNSGYGATPSWYVVPQHAMEYFTDKTDSVFWNPESVESCPSASYCQRTQAPFGGYQGFGTLYAAFLTVFRLSLRSPNTSVFLTGLVHSTGWPTVLYVIGVVVFIAFLMMSLFIAIVRQSYLEVKKDFIASQFRSGARRLVISWTHLLSHQQRKHWSWQLSPSSYLSRLLLTLRETRHRILFFLPPESPFVHKISHLIWSPYFEYVVCFVIFLNTGFACSRYAGMSASWAFVVAWSEVFFTVFFFVEMMMKVIGLWGLMNYLKGVQPSTFFLSISRFSRGAEDLTDAHGNTGIGDGAVVWEPILKRTRDPMLHGTWSGDLCTTEHHTCDGHQCGLMCRSRWDHPNFSGLTLSKALTVSSEEELNHVLPNKSGPGSTFSSKWHLLEGFIVVVSVIILFVDVASDNWPGHPRNLDKNDVIAGGAFQPTFLRVFRVLRLLRLLTVFKFSSTMTNIWKAMETASRELVDLFIVLALFIAVYALIGMQLLGRGTDVSEAADPLMNFDSFGKAMLALFRLITRGSAWDSIFIALEAQDTNGKLQLTNFEEDQPDGPGTLVRFFTILYYFSYIFMTLFITINILVVIIFSKFALEGVEKHSRRLEYAASEFSRYMQGFKKRMLRENKRIDFLHSDMDPEKEAFDIAMSGSSRRNISYGSSTNGDMQPIMRPIYASDSDDEVEEAHRESSKQREPNVSYHRTISHKSLRRHRSLTKLAFMIQYRLHNGMWRNRGLSSPTLSNTPSCAGSERESNSGLFLENSKRTDWPGVSRESFVLDSSRNVCVWAQIRPVGQVLQVTPRLLSASLRRVDHTLRSRDEAQKRLVPNKPKLSQRFSKEPSWRVDRGYACFCIGRPEDSGLRRACLHIVYSSWFEKVVVVMILVSSILLAADDPRNPTSDTARALDRVEFAVTIFFIVEAVVRSVAHGFVIGERSYLKDPWNRLDFFVVVVSSIGVVSDLVITGSPFGHIEDESSDGSTLLTVSRLLRIARILRPLRMISRNEGLRVVTSTVFFGLPGVLFTLALMVVVFIVFAIAGITLFGGQLQACNDITVTYRSQCEGVFENPATGLLTPRVWSNPPFHFDHVGEALTTLFEVSTLRNWPMVLNAITGIQGIDRQPRPGSKPWNSIYLVLFIFIASLFLTNVFIGVIVGAFRQRRGTGLLTSMQKRFQSFSLYLRSVHVPLAPPKNPLRKRVYDVLMYQHGHSLQRKQHLRERKLVRNLSNDAARRAATGRASLGTRSSMVTNVASAMTVLSRKPQSQTETYSSYESWDTLFERIVSTVIFVHVTVVVLAQIVEGAHFDQEFGLQAVFLTFNILYVIEFVIRAIGFGFSRWLMRDGAWMIWDSCIVLLSLVAVIAGLDWHAVTVARALRFDRIVKHFPQQMKGMKTLLLVMYYAMPTILNITGLVLLMSFLYAVLGVQLFSAVKHGEHLRSRYNFEDFWSSIFLLFNILSGEDWVLLMYDCGISPPHCTEASANVDTSRWGAPTDCGSLTLSTIFFYSFHIVHFMILLNLYVAAIVDIYVTLQPPAMNVLANSKEVGGKNGKPESSGKSEEEQLVTLYEVELSEVDYSVSSIKERIERLLGEPSSAFADIEKERDFRIMAPSSLFTGGIQIRALDVEAFRIVWKRFDACGSGYIYSYQVRPLLITLWLLGHSFLNRLKPGEGSFAGTRIERARLRVLVHECRNASFFESVSSFIDDAVGRLSEFPGTVLCSKESRKEKILRATKQTPIQAQAVHAAHNYNTQTDTARVSQKKRPTLGSSASIRRIQTQAADPARMKRPTVLGYSMPARVHFHNALRGLIDPFVRNRCLLEHQRTIRAIEEEGIKAQVAAMTIQRWFRDIVSA